MVGGDFFFISPVYRLDEEKYYANLNKDFESVVSGAWDQEFREKHPDMVQGWRNHHHTTYGGAWDFNEIVGYIKLYFLGTQVRGEYWSTIPKRKIRTRRKQFEYKTHKMYVEIEIREKTKEGILAAIEEYLEGCARELKNRHIDRKEFDKLKNHIDWPAVFRENNSFA
jgi:hypothetical protein